MTLALRSCTVVLVLAACGPGVADSTGDTGTTIHNEGSAGGSATSDTPTSDTPGDATATGADPSGDPPAPVTTSSAGTAPDDATTSGATTSGDDTSGGVAMGRLIGLGAVEGDNHWNIVELDRFTGELTVLAALPDSIGSITQGSGAFDPATRRIFHPTGDGRLLVVDGDSGGFLGAPTLTPDEFSFVMNLEINNAGELVGLSTAAPTHTVTIDLDTGVVTPLAALPLALADIQEGTGAFDHATNRMFQLTGDRNLLTIDANTGALLGHVGLTGDVLELAVNNAGELVGLGNNTFPNPWLIVRVDPLTGVVTTLSELSSGIGFVQGQNIHDPAVDQMFLQTGNPELLVIDAGTGELVATTPIAPGFLNPVLVP